MKVAVGLGVGGDATGGERGLIVVDRLRGGDPGDGGLVAGVAGFLGVLGRRREEAAQGVDHVPADAGGEALAEGFDGGVWVGVWGLGCADVVHADDVC